MTKHVPLNEVDSFGGFDVVSNWDPKRMAKKIFENHASAWLFARFKDCGIAWDCISFHSL